MFFSCFPCPGREGAGGPCQGKKQEEKLQTFFPRYSGNSGCGSYDLIWTGASEMTGHRHLHLC